MSDRWILYQKAYMMQQFHRDASHGWIKNIPQDYMTDNICQTAMRSRCIYTTKDLPEKFRTYEMYKLAVEHNGCRIQFIPKDMRTLHPDLYRLSVKNDVYAFKFIPRRYRTDEMINKVLDKDGTLLRYITTRDRTVEKCMRAVRQTKSCLSLVPKRIREDPVFLIESGLLSYIKKFNCDHYDKLLEKDVLFISI